MGNTVLKLLVRVFLPLILVILATVLIVALVKSTFHVEEEKDIIQTSLAKGQIRDVETEAIG